MEFDQPKCRQCGETLPIGANYCPGCGLARSSLLLDPLGVGSGTAVDAAPVAPRGERSRLLFGLGVAVAAVALVGVALTAGGSESDEPQAESASDDDPAAVDPSTSASTTTRAPTTMERAAPESTEPVGPIVGYVNDTPGPVLGPEVEGVIIAVGERALSRLDLATGAVESIELDWPVDSSWESSEVVIDGKLVAISAGDHLVTTDLTTGAQDERVELDRDDFGLGGARLIGRAGPESVWLASYDGSFDESPAAVEVDLGGTVLRRLQLGSRFYPQAALGRIVYVSGGGAMWRYDTETETSVPFAILGPPRGDQMVVVSCRPTLVCEAAVETESGLEPVPGLLSTDLGNGSLLLSPHRQQAVVSDYGSGGQPVVTHIDLVTGERTDLGRGSWIDPFMGAVWPSDGGWIVGRVSENGRRLFAIEVETFEEVLIELPDGADGFGLDPWATRLLFQPST